MTGRSAGGRKLGGSWGAAGEQMGSRWAAAGEQLGSSWRAAGEQLGVFTHGQGPLLGHAHTTAPPLVTCFPFTTLLHVPLSQEPVLGHPHPDLAE